jgi:hypothetical protein
VGYYYDATPLWQKVRECGRKGCARVADFAYVGSFYSIEKFHYRISVLEKTRFTLSTWVLVVGLLL